MSSPQRRVNLPNRGAGSRCGWWFLVVATGLVVIQLFSLGHLALFAHTRCEHGQIVHAARDGWEQDVRLPPGSDGPVSIRTSDGSAVEHVHCDALATPPAVACLSPVFSFRLLLDGPRLLGVAASEAESVVPLLALAPKTSPTA